MVKRSRLRRFCKWAGLGVSILLVVGWAISVTTSVTVASYGRGRVSLLSGGIMFFMNPAPLPTEARQLRERKSIRWSPTLLTFGGPRIAFIAFVPFWCLLLLAIIPTVLLWRRDRRIPPGHCQNCEYDLTGNVSGVCSECGTAVPNTTSAGK